MWQKYFFDLILVVFITFSYPSCFCTSFGEFVMSNPSIVLRLSSPASSALYLFFSSNASFDVFTGITLLNVFNAIVIVVLALN